MTPRVSHGPTAVAKPTVGRSSGSRRVRPPSVYETLDAAIEECFRAGLCHLHRPDDPSDPYHTTEAVRAWAECKTGELERRDKVINRDPSTIRGALK